MATITIIDREKESAERLSDGLKEHGYRVRTYADGAHALADLRTEPGDLVVAELDLPDLSGIDLLREVKRVRANLPVVIMTQHANTQDAIDTMREGAYDYLPKPVDVDRVLEVITRILESAGPAHKSAAAAPSASAQARAAAGPRARMVGASPEIIEIYKMIGQVAQSDAAVLIQGESGTGKELVASAIHENSGRRERPFLPVNCAAIPETLLESELFGYERGAFTGASQTKIGKFEQCHGGTIFLDEIGDMSLSTQAKVLRVLQEQKFERVGGRETLHVDTRVIAATNKSLVECIKNGAFRVDLFYRLKVVSIYLPPLRDRGGDVLLLADHFLQRFNASLGKQVRGASPEALDLLRRHSWPGNVRELENAIQTAVLLNKTGLLVPADFPFGAETASTGSRTSPEAPSEEGLAGSLRQLFVREFDALAQLHRGRVYEQTIEEVEKALLSIVLERFDDNQVRAARFLGISRNTLRSRIERFYKYERRDRGAATA
jgi:two-component system, NtrC family, nitrogen regulation response regulator GlnG